MKKLILIVDAGGKPGVLSPHGEFDIEIAGIRGFLEVAEKDRMEIQVINSAEGVEANPELQAVIFMSTSMEATAERIKQARPDVNVIMLRGQVGFMHNDQVIFLDRQWVTPEVIHRIVTYR